MFLEVAKSYLYDFIFFCLQECPGLAHPFLMIFKLILRGDCSRPATIQHKTLRSRGLSIIIIVCASD